VWKINVALKVVTYIESEKISWKLDILLHIGLRLYYIIGTYILLKQIIFCCLLLEKET